MSEGADRVFLIPATVDRAEALALTAVQINKDAGDEWISPQVADAAVDNPLLLFESVHIAVANLLLHDPARLQHLLYRFDVAERDALHVFSGAREYHAELLTQMLVQQALRKVLYRLHYRG
jgi:hypothetical protein